MNKTSWRHHYIPQFYLNGFTSEEGNFKIFDVEKNDFVKGGKDFYPESYFFEKNGNSWITENEDSDFIEESYKNLDNKAAEIFNRINKSSQAENYNVSEKDMPMLQYFIGLMYWRNPSNYEKIKNIVDQKQLKDLGLRFTNEKNEYIENPEMEKIMKNDDNFIKTMKIWFPSISYLGLLKCNTPLHIISIPQGFPSICSDNPLICRNPKTFQVYSDDFIFPLNTTKLFIRGDELIDFMSTVKVEIDLLIFKQAKKYVCCTDSKYLEELNKMYNKNNLNLDFLRKSIFKKILNYAT